MAEHCEKLSPLIEQSADQTLGEYLRTLYPIYEQKIASVDLWFHGKPVYLFRELNYNLQQQSFEHLTTKGNNDRLYNLKRCERLVWIHDILQGICDGCTDFRVFRDPKWRSRKHMRCVRYIIWCVKEDYVIVLEDRQDKVMLITAYCVLYTSKKKALESMYQDSLK